MRPMRPKPAIPGLALSGLALSGLALALALLVLIIPLAAQGNQGNQGNQGEPEQFVIGYVELKDDPRYHRGRMDARIPGQPWGRPFPGAEVGAEDGRFPMATIPAELSLKRVVADKPEQLQGVLKDLAEAGVRFVVLDLPDELVAQAAGLAEANRQVLFNISASSDELRHEACNKRLFHTAASDSMRMHGLSQHLVARRWKNVLVLLGPEEADIRQGDAFKASARRFGLKIVDTRNFVRGSDPRQREANNLDLLTRGSNFDVIYIADSNGDFAQTVPYATRAPRPVVGSGGLVPMTWHWNWPRHGAPQLNNRVERKAGRLMTEFDWAAWASIKAITDAATRVGSTDPDAVAAYLRSEDFVLDGFQGYRLSFRPWNNQLRTPVFLASANWVAAQAPFDGFEHPRDNLDTLGLAERESPCRL